ncbi:NAD(P)-dependent alcohol dehydrogenase [Massilia cavernae]|uniref:NAD(P)-dependent alcohol dehydrogenase n=1 Tax=Massilia cavernae TaxID=2320864 RepID=A0A418X6Z7_9BURK|nr:NAD(P)-dependent alcohol dehydrogenase [Massilia cavernae]RJG08269.1 NAD(P)-dependent alcohol dehydrogenase [Massilia cavernae]
MEIQAAVARTRHGALSVETVKLVEPNADEVLVRMVATGICHTDLAVIDEIMPVPLPLVLGHEGAGVIERMGAGVRGLEVGDHVVLTFSSCGHCHHCEDHHPAYCEHYGALNFATRRPDGTTTITDSHDEPVGSVFFSQSSFATYAIATAKNVVRVRKDAPLELLGPLGCGLSTGAGTVLNVLKPKPSATLAVFGTGALGSAAIMASKFLGVKRIIAVDRVESRLTLARELGATDTIDTSKQDLEEALASLGGIDFAIDTSGVPKLIEAAVAALRTCGTCVLLGASKNQDLHLSVFPLISGKSIRGVVNGDCEPQELIPKLVDMHLAGDFPMERLAQFYPLADINEAVADSVSGKVIKPIIRF